MLHKLRNMYDEPRRSSHFEFNHTSDKTTIKIGVETNSHCIQQTIKRDLMHFYEIHKPLTRRCLAVFQSITGMWSHSHHAKWPLPAARDSTHASRTRHGYRRLALRTNYGRCGASRKEAQRLEDGTNKTRLIELHTTSNDNSDDLYPISEPR